MKQAHIAFCLEQAYGHITPTLGMSLELIKRGHKVTYAVTNNFAALINRVRATPAIIDPQETRRQLLAGIIDEDDQSAYKLTDGEVDKLWRSLSAQRTECSLNQLEKLFYQNPPDVIIHDDCLDTAGRELASKWSIPKIRHRSQFIEEREFATEFQEDEIVLVTVPRFFQRSADSVSQDRRFIFVGFLPEGRKEALQSRRANFEPGSILISPTTGLLPQLHFCEVAVDALRGEPWKAVLSISGSLDSISAINPRQLTNLPNNIVVNLESSNLEILETASLFIGQGGQGATLEAIFCGVPQILAPPTPFHHSVACRVRELGLGSLLPMTEFSEATLREHVATMLRDKDTLCRVKLASAEMKGNSGSQLAANAVEEYLSGRLLLV